MNFPKINRPSLMVFLLSTIGIIETIATNSAFEQQDEPFWQFVLREFVFKTISPPLPDNALYKKLQDAPFYGGSLPEAHNAESALLSRGNVYRLPDEQWIFCQDDCEKCEACLKQKNPTVKWTLRRVRRLTSMGSPKWDLQLTVLPQLHEIFQSGPSDRGPENHAYEMRDEDEPVPASSHVLSTTDRAIFHKEQRNRLNRLPGANSDSKKDSTVRSKENRQAHSRKIRERTKRRRSKIRPIGRPGPLAFYYPQEDQPIIKNPTDRPRDDANPRLIMGIDQHGEKHLVHVVPIYSPLRNEGNSGYFSSYRESYQMGNSPRISRTAQPYWDQNVYDKLIDRILDSLNTNRNFIEKFLFSERLEPVSPKEPFIPPYSTYPESINEDERFQSRNDDTGYHDGSPHGASRYPMESEYQVDEEDQQYRLRADRTKEVNRPTGVHQDQSSMMEYEPYGMSENDQQHDELSSLRVDAERRRRNSRGEPTHSSSTFGRKGFNENHNQWNSTDQGLGNSQLEINRMDSRIQNSSIEITTVKVQTGELGDFL